MFSTESKYGDLLVLSLPTEAPTIQGGQTHYAPGDFLHLNCSSYESKPAADLSWFVNDQKVETGTRLFFPTKISSGPSSGQRFSQILIFPQYWIVVFINR